MNDQEPAAEAAVRTAGDRWIIAAARRTGLELRRRPGDVDRFAGALLAELADRLDASGIGTGREPEDDDD